MLRSKCRLPFPLPLFFLIVGFIFFQLTAPLPAQETGRPVGDIGAAKPNEEAVQKLRKMNPEEIKNLDAFLQKALTLYYDRKFALALPIFKEIADKVETMDIMFWVGTSAAKLGETDLAIEEFNKMLRIDPNLHRVRLELASVYFSRGRFPEAQKELQTVLSADPPPEVKVNIDKMLAAITERTRKWSGNFRLSTGFMWDDNISSGPDPGIYSLPGGSAFRPLPTSAKLSDQASVTSFSGNFLYDFGKKKDLMWNTATSFYYKAYLDYSQFDYMALDVNTGPWWAGRQSILKIPAGYTHTKYGSERLSYILHVDPSYEYFFNPNFSLRGAYTYKDERFYQKIRSGFDNIGHIIEFAPTFYLDNRRHIITASMGYDHHTAKSDFYTYSAPIAGISYFTRFPTRTELYLGYQWTRRDYSDTQPAPYIGLKRTDTRQFYTVVLSQVFYKHFNVSYSFTYTDNSSDLDLSTWDKMTNTISVGFQF